MTRQEANKLISKWGGALPKLLRLLYKPEAINRFPNVQVGMGGGAYTDGKKLYVGLQESMVKGEQGFEDFKGALGHEPTAEEAEMCIIANGYHELFHIFFSDWKEMEAFRNFWTEEFRPLWDGKSDHHKNLVARLGQFWNNAVEDGRIENLGGNTYPGTIKKLRFSNLLMWCVHSEHKSKSEFRNFSMAMCFYATTGIFPEWWADESKEMHDAMDIICPGIDKAINIGNPTVARREFQKDVLRIKKFILDLLEKEMKNADTMEALEQFVQQIMDEFAGASGQGAGGSGGAKSTADIGSGGASVRIQIDAGEEGDEGDSGSDGDQDDEKDGKGQGEDEDKDGEEKDKSSGSDEGDGSGEDAAEKIKKERRAPGHAERGGKEGKTDKKTPPVNNNGQGTTDGTNVAPDKSDETLTHSKKELIAEVKAELDAISEQSSEEVRREERKVKKAEAEKSAADESLSASEIEEIRSGYKDSGYYRTEGYKEVKVTAKEKADPKVMAEGRKFRREVEKLLKSQQDSVIRGTTRGRLSPSMLYRMRRNDFAIFEQKSTPDKTDAAVYILWDNSGSMCGSKQRLSTIACSVIEEGLKGLIPIKITAFTTECGMVKHFKVKDFADKAKSHNYAWSHGTARSFGGGNKDGYSIKIATKEIMKRPEKLKLLIVLSDGLPSDYPGIDYAMNDVKQAVKTARKNGVEVISVMFGEDDFRESEWKNYELMYETGIIATSPEKLTAALVKQIRKILFNKGR